MTAIKREFTQNGTTEDRANLNKVLTGTTGDGKTLDALMVHASTTVAGLQRYHVLALRLYTTSSYRRLNDPLRTTPPTRPNRSPPRCTSSTRASRSCATSRRRRRPACSRARCIVASAA